MNPPKSPRKYGSARSLLLPFALYTACQSAPYIDDSDPNRPGADSGMPDGGSNGGGDGGAAGLPCDVEMLLKTRCQGCHGQPLAGGAPIPLRTYEDLARPSQIDPAVSVAARSLLRMTDAMRPMPPGAGPTVPQDALAVFRAFVEGGLPKGSCGASPDGGGGDAGGNDPLNAPARCTSNRYWTRGDDESPQMHPGRACIQCHTARRKGPSLSVGGTVYPSGHEPDECLGQLAATVEITDADKRVVRLLTNISGNFLYETRSGTLRFPITAKVLYGGKERAMLTPQMSGDCNLCHTQNGANGAPGRITLPY